MAGIEKICEYSGDYRGGEMYAHKRDHIQVFPEYRKHFAHAPHMLIFFRPSKVWTHSRFSGIEHYEYTPDFFDPPCASEKQFIEQYGSYFNVRLADEWWFLLHCPSVPGKVDGFYWNHTMSKMTVRRRLKRMLKCKTLNEFRSDLSMHDASYILMETNDIKEIIEK